jgi:hypothetical protein
MAFSRKYFNACWEGPALSGESPAYSSLVMLAHVPPVDAARLVAMAAVQTFPDLFGHLKILPASNSSENVS